MICPNCEYEYVDALSVCPDCGAQLVTEEDFEGNLVTHKDWVIVHTTDEDYKAEMYKANLEGAGIETSILNLSDRNFPTNAEFRYVKIAVRKEDAVRAAEIINDIDRQQESDDE